MDSALAEKNASSRIDLLDRQGFIDQLREIVSILAKNKKNMCYSINGQWGVGKTYVLDMFEEQAQCTGQEGTVLDKYIIFRYNCWEYDYYDEPIIAIVASIIEQYDEKISLFDEKEKAAIDEVFKRTFIHIGKALLALGSERLKGLTGINIDPEKVGQFVKETVDIANNVQGKINDNHSYDKLSEFKEVLNLLRESLTKLTQYHTVLIIVDELDRCLPEYTIRVLERLHHLFYGIPNIQVIISTDRQQLEHTVKQIFGADTNAKKYLDKFISFELELSFGSLNDSADTYFAYYYDQFENQRQLISSADFKEFKSIILEGIDTRSRIAIIEKCNLLHNILKKDDAKSDVVFNAIQIFLTVLKYYNLDPKKAKDQFSPSSLFEGVLTCKDQNEKQKSYTLPGLATIRKKIESPNYTEESNYLGTQYMQLMRNNRTLVLCEDLWGILLAAYRTILGFEGDAWHYTGPSDASIKEYVLAYWKLLKTIA